MSESKKVDVPDFGKSLDGIERLSLDGIGALRPTPSVPSPAPSTPPSQAPATPPSRSEDK